MIQYGLKGTQHGMVPCALKELGLCDVTRCVVCIPDKVEYLDEAHMQLQKNLPKKLCCDFK